MKAVAIKVASSFTTKKKEDTFEESRKLDSFQSRTTWKQLGSDIEGDQEYARFGTAVSLSSNGNRLAISAPYDDGTGQENSYRGKVQLMDFMNGQWVQIGEDLYGYNDADRFGASLSLSANGNRLASGSPMNSDKDLHTGDVRIYELDIDSSTWVQLGSKIDGEGRGDRFGTSVALSSDGSIVAAGAPYNDADPGNNVYDSGHVKVLKFNGDDWVQMGDDINGNFGVASCREAGGFAGSSIALSADGLRLAFNDKKVVRVFDYNGESWIQVGEDIVQSYINIFSLSMSADGNRLVVGNPGYRYVGNEGSINIYDYVDGTWQQVKTFSGVGEADRLGSSVSISGDGSSVFAGATTSTPYVDDILEGNGYVQTYKFNNSDWGETIKFIGDSPGDFFGSSVASSSDGATFAVGATLAVFNSVGLVKVFQMGVDSCHDSPFRFRTKKPSGEAIWRDCKWVATRSTEWRCQNFEGVSTMCPSTCSLCNQCVDSTSRMKFYKTPDATKKIARSCDWTATYPGARCQIEGMEDSCRKTCNNC